MMSREHWNQVTLVVGLIALIGGAQWAVSKLHEGDIETYATLAQQVSADERDLRLLRTEVEQLERDQAKLATEASDANRQFASQLAVLQATWDLLKDQDHYRQHSR